MQICAIIPARIGSTRLAKKALLPLNGKAMILHVIENAKKSNYINDVYVATDHQDIKNCVEAAGGKAILTSEACPSGTDRIIEALSKLNKTYDYVVNVQGDEPLLKAELIDQTIDAILQNTELVASTLASTTLSKEDYLDPNRVKVIKNSADEAIYFSRSPIPFNRDSAQLPSSALLHIGLYVYKASFLRTYGTLPASTLEEYEKLEQLRILENNYKIAVTTTEFRPIGVDVESDLAIVEERLKEELH